MAKRRIERRLVRVQQDAVTGEPLVTIGQAAALVGRKPATVASWVAVGALPVAGRRYCRRLVRPSEVRAVAARMAAAPQGRNNRDRARHEPTAEELERIIAERMQCLPDWWWSDCAEQNGPEFAAAKRAEHERTRDASQERGAGR
ncbi:MAG: hypothetical protein E6Q76_01120 [Rhizobium sp.]|nr:MAG: hypothetical protein E6Q76_01120 [Rhizobium sp.]